MASIRQGQDSVDAFTILCTEFNPEEHPDELHEIEISTAEINSWDLPSILANTALKIEVNPNRLIEESSYFRGLLRGSFSEAGLDFVSIHWNLESFLSILRFIFGCNLEVTWDNFIPLNEAALFFGVEKLLLKCQVWLDEATSFRGLQTPQLCLDGLIHIWKYSLESANDFVQQLCASYLARNFMWALSLNSFNDIPDKLLSSCIKHPDLTVDSEKHLCNAILVWVTAKTAKSEGWISNIDCHQIRTSLLPLWFATGKQRCNFFLQFADKAVGTILSLARHPRMFRGDLSHHSIRLTKYTQKLDLSGCPQITPGLFLLSVLPSSISDSIFGKISKKSPFNHVDIGVINSVISESLEQILTFEAVQEVDISNCPSLPLESAIDCFCKSFPSLRTLRAAYFLNFKTAKLCQLVQKFPLLTNIDLTMDITPVIPDKVSITFSSSILTPQRSTSFDPSIYYSTTSWSHVSQPLLANITKLTLEGRTDFSDADLHNISEVCSSLNYVNMKWCTSVTDCGISVMILKCRRLQSVLACGTSFGNNSVVALCSIISSESQQSENSTQFMGHKLQTLHVGGCSGINGAILSELMCGVEYLRSLCLREIKLVDNALYRFQGSSLEMLDVSNTKVSSDALSHVIRRNPGLKCLKTRGCTHQLQEKIDTEERKLCAPSHIPKDIFSELGKACQLEEIELGWGFSFLSLGALKPAIRTLRTIIVGLGGSLGHDVLELLPTICPLLETLILYFQVISDAAITKLLKTLQHLQFLGLCYCNGGISSLSFKFKMPNLRKLKLERVTPWMTNQDLATLAESCTNLSTFSLIGCKLLNSDSQDIISSCWPGLTSLHLEECGEITANGVRSLFNCHALEDLLLRHTGHGLPRSFIIYAASKLPMLRKISVDICDASEGDFGIPSFADRYFLSIVKIARCQLQKCTLNLHNFEACRTPEHKETLVLVWNSEKLARTVVKERL